jgi:hypothetical protein
MPFDQQSQQLIAGLAREIVEHTAPQEMPPFSSNRQRLFHAP